MAPVPPASTEGIGVFFAASGFRFLRRRKGSVVFLCVCLSRGRLRDVILRDADFSQRSLSDDSGKITKNRSSSSTDDERPAAYLATIVVVDDISIDGVACELHRSHRLRRKPSVCLFGCKRRLLRSRRSSDICLYDISESLVLVLNDVR